MTALDELKFDVTMSVKYHRRRAAFLDRLSAVMSSAILFGSAAAFASLFGEHTIIAKVLTLLLALIGIVQVVFQIDRSAANHRGWLQQWMGINKGINSTPSPTASQVAAWRAEAIDIESECVGEMRALQLDCYNRTISELDRDGVPVSLKWWHRMLMQFHSFEGAGRNAVQ